MMFLMNEAGREEAEEGAPEGDQEGEEVQVAEEARRLLEDREHIGALAREQAKVHRFRGLDYA